MAELFIVELDPAIWMRGTKTGTLLDIREHGEVKTRQQCCVGIACTQFGVKDDDLMHENCIKELPFKVIPDLFTSIADVEWNDEDEEEVVEDNLDELYAYNDSEAVASDEARVMLLNQELERLKATFRFKLKRPVP